MEQCEGVAGFQVIGMPTPMHWEEAVIAFGPWTYILPVDPSVSRGRSQASQICLSHESPRLKLPPKLLIQ